MRVGVAVCFIFLLCQRVFFSFLVHHSKPGCFFEGGIQPKPLPIKVGALHHQSQSAHNRLGEWETLAQATLSLVRVVTGRGRLGLGLPPSTHLTLLFRHSFQPQSFPTATPLSLLISSLGLHPFRVPKQHTNFGFRKRLHFEYIYLNHPI